MVDPRESGAGTTSIVVPCRDASSTLAACLAALRDQLDADCEIVVVDDDSKDASAEIARAYADLVIENGRPEGAAVSRNTGWHASKGQRIVFVDADVVVRPGALSALLGRLAAGWDGAFGAYTPLPPPGMRNAPTRFKNLQQHYTHIRAESPVPSFWSGLGVVRRDALEEVGGFDPAATAGADVEDVDLGYRLHAAGRRICQEPLAQAHHHKRYSLVGMIKSDVLHRAIPWAEMMTRRRTVHARLNLSPGSLVGAMGLVAALGSGAWALLSGSGVATVLAAVGFALWLFAHLGFFSFAVRMSGAAGLTAVPLQLVYGIYAPLGALVGVARVALGISDAHPRPEVASVKAAREPGT